MRARRKPFNEAELSTGSAERLREILIERVDRAALSGPLADELNVFENAVIESGVPRHEAAGAKMRLLQAIQMALFPEAWLEVDELEGRTHGIIRHRMTLPKAVGITGVDGLISSLERYALAPLSPLRRYK